MSIKKIYYKHILFKQLTIINIVLSLFFLLGIALSLYILFIYVKNNNSGLLSSFGIIIASLIASTSLMKSVYETKESNKNIFLLNKLDEVYLKVFSLFEIILKDMNKYNSLNFTNEDAGIQMYLNEHDIASDSSTIVHELTFYFPHLVEEYVNMLQKIYSCNDYNEVDKLFNEFKGLLHKEQFKYIFNKNKIKFK